MNDKKPAHVIQARNLKVTIWRNQDEKRGDWFSVVLSRTYKDNEGKSHTAQTLGRDDLLAGAELLRQAWLWVVQAGPTE
jgi:hypothetical protein